MMRTEQCRGLSRLGLSVTRITRKAYMHARMHLLQDDASAIHTTHADGVQAPSPGGRSGFRPMLRRASVLSARHT